MFSNKEVVWIKRSGLAVVFSFPVCLMWSLCEEDLSGLTGFFSVFSIWILLIMAYAILRTVWSYLSGVFKWMRIPSLGLVTVKEVLIAGYLCFVMGSLFLAPWRGWKYEGYEYKLRVRLSSIFYPPEGLYGSNSFGSQKLPQLLMGQLIVIWIALAIFLIGVFWLVENRRYISSKKLKIINMSRDSRSIGGMN